MFVVVIVFAVVLIIIIDMMMMMMTAAMTIMLTHSVSNIMYETLLNYTYPP